MWLLLLLVLPADIWCFFPFFVVGRKRPLFYCHRHVHYSVHSLMYAYGVLNCISALFVLLRFDVFVLITRIQTTPTNIYYYFRSNNSNALFMVSLFFLALLRAYTALGFYQIFIVLRWQFHFSFIVRLLQTQNSKNRKFEKWKTQPTHIVCVRATSYRPSNYANLLAITFWVNARCEKLINSVKPDSFYEHRWMQICTSSAPPRTHRQKSFESVVRICEGKKINPSF